MNGRDSQDEHRTFMTGHEAACEKTSLSNSSRPDATDWRSVDEREANAWLEPCSPQEALELTDLVLSLRSLAPFARGAGELEGDIPKQIDKYTVIDRVGAGGQAVVWLAYDPDAHRMVIIKRYRPGVLSLWRAGLEEARTLCSVQHPSIVQCLGVGEDSESDYLVLQPVVGQPLHRYCQQQTIDPLQAIDWIAQVARGLEQLHRVGWVHRDIEARNLIVTSDQRLVLVDFGLAGPMDVDGHALDDDGDSLPPRPAPTVHDDVAAVGRLIDHLVLNPERPHQAWVPAGAVGQGRVRRLGHLGRWSLAGLVHRTQRPAHQGGFGSAAELAEALEQFAVRQGRQSLWSQNLVAALALSLAAFLPASFVWRYMSEASQNLAAPQVDDDWSLFVRDWVLQNERLPPLPRVRQQFPLSAQLTSAHSDPHGWMKCEPGVACELELRSPVACEVALFLLVLSEDNAPSISTIPLLESDRRSLRLEANEAARFSIEFNQRAPFEGFLYLIASNGSNNESWRRNASSLPLREFGGEWIEARDSPAAPWQWTSESLIPIRVQTP